MKEGAPVPSEIRLVSNMPFLDHLFVCFAKIKPQAGKLLKRVFSSGKNPPTKLKTALVRYLVYTYDLGEKGFFWEAGPATERCYSISRTFKRSHGTSLLQVNRT